MQVMDRALVFHDSVTVLVSLAVDEALLETTARQPHAESVRVVIAPDGALGERRATELPGEDHQRLVEQAPRFQVFHQCSDRLVHRQSVRAVPEFQFVVLVPRIAHSVGFSGRVHHRQFDEAHAPFH